VDADKCTGCGDCQTNCPVAYQPHFVQEAPRVAIEEEREACVAAIIERNEGEPGSLLPILIDINMALGWLPPDVLHYVSRRLEIPLAEILRVATFYNFFSLVPRGRHTVKVCLGTGCFVNGGKTILNQLERKLAVKSGETTKDMRYSLEVVRCLGCCALAPVVGVNDDVYHVDDVDKLLGILDGYE